MIKFNFVVFSNFMRFMTKSGLMIAQEKLQRGHQHYITNQSPDFMNIDTKFHGRLAFSCRDIFSVRQSSSFLLRNSEIISSCFLLWGRLEQPVDLTFLLRTPDACHDAIFSRCAVHCSQWCWCFTRPAAWKRPSAGLQFEGDSYLSHLNISQVFHLSWVMKVKLISNCCAHLENKSTSRFRREGLATIFQPSSTEVEKNLPEAWRTRGQ